MVVGRQVEGIGLEERKIGWVEASCTRALRMIEAEVPRKLVLDWEEHILVLAEAEEERKPGLVVLEGHTLVVEVERKPLVGAVDSLAAEEARKPLEVGEQNMQRLVDQCCC